jgi:hypothetical protein
MPSTAKKIFGLAEKIDTASIGQLKDNQKNY